jgi:hypothetical protein
MYLEEEKKQHSEVLRETWLDEIAQSFLRLSIRSQASRTSNDVEEGQYHLLAD